MPKHLAIVYVDLPEEETSTMRPTKAEILGDNRYKLLPTDRYDPENEVWEFLPGSIVTCVKVRTDDGQTVLLAVKQVG